MKPIIGIVGRCGFDVTTVSKICDGYRNSVINSGGIPIGILPTQCVSYYDSRPSELNRLTDEEKDMIITQLKMCNGVIIPGGLKRFEYDLFIINYCLVNDIPILGICLGMQAMTMIDDSNNEVLKLEKIESDINHADYDNPSVHDVILDKNSNLYKIIGCEKFTVNSRHKMMITDPNTFEIVGKSTDGVIEAIERKDKKFAIGVQWHPELLSFNSDLQKKIFDSFIDACRGENYEN